MKYTLLFSFIFITMFSSTAANKTEKTANEVVESISLNNVTMKEAARMIAIATKTPIVVSYDAAKVIVDMHLSDVTALEAVEAICRASGLWYQKNKKDRMLHIMTIDEFKNSLQFNRQEKIEVIQILYPSVKDIADALSKLFVNRVIWIDPKKNSGDSYSEINRALKRMDLLGDRGTFDISGDGESDSNSSSNSDDDDDDDDDDDGDDQKTEAKKASIHDLTKVKNSSLKQLFTNQQKKEQLELKFHKLTNSPGIVFISVLPENNSLMLRSADANAIDEMLKVVEKLDKPIPQVLLEVKILTVRLDDSKDRAVDFLFSNNSGEISGGFADGLLTTDGGQAILKPNAELIPQGSGIDTQAAIFNTVTNNFRARIQMLEKDERITKLATPNLIVCNNESSTLFIGTETTVLEKAQSTTTYTEVSSGVFQPNISWEIDAPRRRVGTSLLLTPKIHADRTVTLRLLQEQSSLGQKVDNVYSGGSSTVGSEDQYFVSQNIDMQRVITTVVGKDQEFMVISGLVYEEITKDTEKTPFLSALPIIGELAFTRLEATRTRNELIIIIRPFVIQAPGESQLVSQSYLKRMSQHPAARDDLPSLGVNTPNELAKPKVVDPNAPWLVKMFDKLQGWGVDDTTSFDVYRQFRLRDRQEQHQKALKEIERLMKSEKD